MTLTLSIREFYAVYGKEGDNIFEEGKVLDLSHSFLDNLYEMHERMNCIFFVLLNSISVISGQWEDDNVMKSCVQRDPIYG